MPYEYRKMTPKEREEVLRQRRERGYPLHAPPHPFREGGQYMLSAANYQHSPVMISPARRTDFERRLLAALQGILAEVFAWIILPNHYHVLVEVASLDTVSAGLKQLHGTTSREWNVTDGQTGARRVWYKSSDRLLRNEKHFYQAFNYVHANPVKHKYVEDPYEWPWSSIHSYREALGHAWLRETWKAHSPPSSFGRGWDD